MGVKGQLDHWNRTFILPGSFSLFPPLFLPWFPSWGAGPPGALKAAPKGDQRDAVPQIQSQLSQDRALTLQNDKEAAQPPSGSVEEINVPF